MTEADTATETLVEVFSAKNVETNCISNVVSSATNNSSNNLKRKAFDRLAKSTTKTLSGRGSLVGWTSCPMCGRHSSKRFALGRGIASHLYAVHTPWNPGKAERNKRRRLEERQRSESVRQQKLQQQQQQQPINDTNSNSNNHRTVAVKEEKSTNSQNNEEGTLHSFTEVQTWQPTRQEVDEWDARVLEIVKELEAKAAQQANEESSSSIGAGFERNGQESKSYRDSLPPFLQAAADGDLYRLEQLVAVAKQKGECLRRLLDTHDRHISTAEHWAAGGGHVNCLQFLLRTRYEIESARQEGEGNVKRRKIRRRDGKTCLHYAARYGQLDCAKYLLDVACYAVDEASGDGTTPLHLACYGLHVDLVRFLLEKGANVKATNEWGCSAAHWMAMASHATSPSFSTATGTTSSETTGSPTQIRDLANLLKTHGVSFVERQKQGHSALHKAAQRQNRDLLEWLAQSAEQGGAALTADELKDGAAKDDGGHTPSAIWRSVGGDSVFAQWMEEQGW